MTTAVVSEFNPCAHLSLVDCQYNDVITARLCYFNTIFVSDLSICVRQLPILPTVKCRSLICFFLFGNRKECEASEIHRQLVEVLGKNARSDGMEGKWIRQFNAGSTNVHDEA
ncbi:hypothetical protein TNCV_3050221 [Trichonephila clavipes]|nr:hypothetical protein TNCV_3050221 [Trichonephila clavipes]